MTPITIVLAILGSSVITAFLTLLFNRRTARVEANHIVVDTAKDALAMAKGTYEQRIKSLEQQVKSLATELEKLQRERTKEHEQYERDTREMGKRLSDALTAIQLLRSRLDELLDALEKAGGTLPDWAAKNE